MYEEEYHLKFHKNLLTNKEYYIFRAKISEKVYWKYLKGKVLEFGCGLGQNIFLHKEDSIGIDISNFCIKECEGKGIKVVRDIKKIKKDSIDSILICHCLEHLENPIKILKEIYMILKKGGKIIVVLPVPTSRNKPIKNFKSDIAKHIFSWDFNSINELLSYVNFKVELNKFNYGYGYSKFYKLPFNLGYLFSKLIGFLMNKKEMIVVAEK